MANGKIPNFNNKFYGDKLVEVTFPDSTGSLGFDEYNAVLNNANSSITSSKIMNADYALNARIPTNNDRLISGTAQRMEIQDSNYSSVAWTSPRYVGSQTISARYNDYTPSGSSVTFADGTTGTWKGDQVFDEYPGDSTFTRGNPLGKVPAIDLYSTHFVLFDRININDAIFDRDIFHCLYLIDDQGNKVPLTYKNKNLVDLRRLFIQGSNAEVVFLGQNNQDLLDEYPIERVGIVRTSDFSITNDLFVVDDTQSPNFLYPANNAPIANNFIPGNGAASTRFTFIWNRGGNTQPTTPIITQNSSILYTGVPITPGLFQVVQNQGNQNYRVRYGENTDTTLTLTRFDLLNNGFNIGCSHQNLLRLSYNNQSPWFRVIPQYNTGPTVVKTYQQNPITGNYPETYAATTGSYINNAPPFYPINENKLDPYYALTYNPQNKKVFEGTIYETIILDAQFTAVNPLIGNFTDLGQIQTPNVDDGTLNVSLPDSMEPISTLGTSNSPALTIGSSLSWGDVDITSQIDANILTPSNINDVIKEQLPASIQAETLVNDISIGKINTQRIYYSFSGIVPSFTPNGNVEVAGGAIYLGMAAKSYNDYYRIPYNTPYTNGYDVDYPNNVKYLNTDSAISTSLEPVVSNNYLACGMIVGNSPNYPINDYPSVYSGSSPSIPTQTVHITGSLLNSITDPNGGYLFGDCTDDPVYTPSNDWNGPISLMTNGYFGCGLIYRIDLSDPSFVSPTQPDQVYVELREQIGQSQNPSDPPYTTNVTIGSPFPGNPGAYIEFYLESQNFPLNLYLAVYRSGLSNYTPNPLQLYNQPFASQFVTPEIETYHALFDRPTHAWSSIHPGDIHTLYLPTKAGSNIGNLIYSTSSQALFYQQLGHGDIIELTDTDIFPRTLPYTDAQNISPLTEQNPASNPNVWRFMILRAPDKYDDSSVEGGGSGEGERGCYRFYVKYINGRTDNLEQDYPELILPPASVPPSFFPDEKMNIFSSAHNISYNTDTTFARIGIENNNRKVIRLYSIKKMAQPYIDVTQTQGNDLETTINKPSTVLSTAVEKEHEQYIESQFLTGTGVGVLIPDNYDPKLREQLPDIINKTGIDINSLIQGNN
jgi:hypothetical protein